MFYKPAKDGMPLYLKAALPKQAAIFHEGNVGCEGLSAVKKQHKLAYATVLANERVHLGKM